MAAVDERQAALDLLRQWIIKALQSQCQGNGAAYWKLLDQMETIRADPEKVRVFALCVSYFDSAAHEALLMQLLGLSIWTCSPAVGEALLEFAVNLACVRPACLPLALDFLVRGFMPPSCGIPAFMGLTNSAQKTASAAQQQQHLAQAIAASRGNKSTELQHKEQVIARLRSALVRVLALVPQAPSVLVPLVSSRLPHRRLDKEFQCVFFEALFAIAEDRTQQSSAVRDSFLAAVIDHLIHIDVEIRWEDILEKQQQQLMAHSSDSDGECDRTRAGARAGECDRDGVSLARAAKKGRRDVGGAKSVYLFHMDLDDVSDDESVPAPHLRQSEASGPGSEAAALHGLVACRGRASAQEAEVVDEMADKMDALMELTFAHLQRRAAEGPEAAMALYRALEHSFDATVLETHKSKFVQFLLFYACSLPQAPPTTQSPTEAPTEAPTESSQDSNTRGLAGQDCARESILPDKMSGRTPTEGSSRHATPAAAAAFASHLLSLLQSPAQPPNARLSAVAYLASYLARASYVHSHTVLSVLSELTAWCLDSAALSSAAPSTTPRLLKRSASRNQGVVSRVPEDRASQGFGFMAQQQQQYQQQPCGLKNTLSSPALAGSCPPKSPRPALSRTPSASLLQPCTAPTGLSPLPVLRSASAGLPASASRAAATPFTPGPAPRAVLQGACQAILYVLCFRMEDMASHPSLLEALRGIPLEALLASPLRPLETTLESIVSEFKRQATHLHLVDFLAVSSALSPSRSARPSARSSSMKQHETTTTSSSSSMASPIPRQRLHFEGVGGEEEGGYSGALEQRSALPEEAVQQRLDMFFPFDPYLLRTSLRFVKPLFKSWKQPFLDLEDQEEQEEQEEEEQDEQEAMEEVDGAHSEEEWSSEEEMEHRESLREGNGMPGHDRLGGGLWGPFDDLDPQNGHDLAEKAFSRGLYSGFSPVDCSPRSFECDRMMMSCTPPTAHLPARLSATVSKRL